MPHDSSFLATKIKKLSKALENKHTLEIEGTLEELKKIVSTCSGNRIFSALIMHETPKIYYISEYGTYPFSESTNPDDINCLTKLLAVIKSAKNNMSFLTYVFDTLLNKLDEANNNFKNIILSFFSESQDNYTSALRFYLSQLSPEKIKDILSSDRLITRIIDIKPLFSEQSALRNTLNELQKYHDGNLYSARDRLRNELKIEIYRLRNKNNLNDTDIELSNILVRIRIDLKKDVTHFSSSELEIALNAEIGQAEKIIQSQKKIDTKTMALLSEIKMIKSWYLLEYQKSEKILFDDLLSIISTPKLTAESEDPIAKKEAIAETVKSHPVSEKPVTIALPPSATVAPRVITPQQSIVTTGMANHFFNNTSADIKALDAIVIPTHEPTIAALRVPNKPPIEPDIIDELFGGPVACKL